MGAVEVDRTPMQGILHVSNKCPLPVFWVRRGGGERIMLRANRYALAAAQDGVALDPAVRDGWDAEAVAEALLTLREPTLW